MADDTRQPKPVPQTAEDLSREALTVDPAQKAFTGQQWVDAKTGKPHRPPQFENANALAGGTENTAGGKVPDVTLSNAFEGSLKWSDFTELPKRPCVRDGFLTGLGAGFAIGGLRLVFRAPIFLACNWAVGTGIAGAAVQYQYCLYRRQQEKDGMLRAVEILNKKEVEKKAREAQRQKAKEERRKLKEAEQDGQFAALAKSQEKGDGGGKSSWKFW